VAGFWKVLEIFVTKRVGTLVMCMEYEVEGIKLSSRFNVVSKEPHIKI